MHDQVELMTGLAACGVHTIVVLTNRTFVPQHPLVPVAVVVPKENVTTRCVLESVVAAQQQHYESGERMMSGFQITRGLLSVSV